MKQNIVTFLYRGLVAILILMPFHAFLATWLGTSLDIWPLLNAWKEILLLLMSVGGLYLLFRNTDVRQWLFRWRVNQLIMVYAVLHLVIGALMQPDWLSFLFGLKYNLEFLVFFLLAQIVAFYIPSDVLRSKVKTWILVPAALVAGFAVIQAMFLPADFLTMFGYGSGTIEPFHIIQDSSVVRVISTLGGPNQLGIYLIFPIMLTWYLLLKAPRFSLAALLALLLGAQLFSFSRSAWLATVVGAVIVVLYALPRPTAKKLLISGAGAVVLMLTFAVAFIRDVPFLQSAILHSNIEKALTESSNSDHVIAIMEGTEATVSAPFGHGPGTAGPASAYEGDVFLPENYYLQVAVETGWLGLTLFLAISLLILYRLLSRRSTMPLAIPLVATFAGIMLVNMLLHGWTASTTALIWWGVAGLFIRIDERGWEYQEVNN